MVSNGDFQGAIELISKSDSILITTHTRPDGDGCGSVAAMADALTALGKNVEVILPSSVPEWYRFLFAKPPGILGKDISIAELTKGRFAKAASTGDEQGPDLIVIVDTNSYSQLAQFEQYLKQTDKPVLVMDHHVTTDGLGTVELIDSDAAATGVIVFDLLKYANWPITEKVASGLFVTIATDTGWFRFGNTDSRVHRVLAELIDAGAKPAQLYHNLYENFSYPRFKLMAAMLNTLELHFSGRYATQHLLQQDFEKTGAAYNDTENLIDECQRIGTVEAAAFFIELADGRIKCSLRSRGAIDVCRIAQKFGGGGHTAASGVHLAGPLGNAKQLIKTEIEKHLCQPTDD